MANETTLKTRIVLKHDTSTNWAQATNFKPKEGELILYTDLKQIKIGDGETTVSNLPFANAQQAVQALSICDTTGTKGYEYSQLKSILDSCITKIVAASGSDIAEVGTPSVTVSTSGNTATLTFHKLKGAKGATGATGVGLNNISVSGTQNTSSGGTSTYTVYYTKTDATGTQIKAGDIKVINGKDGTGVNIKASQSACTTIGDSYIDSSGNLQVLTSITGSTKNFTNAGKIQGPQGPKGDAGAVFVPSVSSDGVLSWTINEGDIPSEVNIKGPKGDNGTTPTVTGSQIATSTADGGTNTYQFKINDTSSNFSVKNGTKGSTGTRGSRWSTGTAITGTSATATVFSSSGITDALVNDMYLNTSTGYVYRCAVAGAASTAKWVYTGSIKGAIGSTGTAAGFGTPTVTVDENTGTPSVTISTSGSNTAKVFNFAFKNLKGKDGTNGTNGKDGTTPTITASATVDANTGTPSVTVTKNGTATNPTFSFAFKNLKGANGTNATTTAVATTTANGLMSSSDKTILNNIPSNYWNLNGGTRITAGDLNNYTTLGNYYCNIDTQAQSLTNIPVSDLHAFIMKIYSATGDGSYITQKLTDYNTQKSWVRTKSGDNWRSWKLVDDDMNNYLPLSGGTLTGALNITGHDSSGYGLTCSNYLKASWLQTTSAGNLGSSSDKIVVLDGSGWLYYRTRSQLVSDLGALTAHRTIQVNSNSIGASTTLNLKAGSNITLDHSNGTVTINSTASGGSTYVLPHATDGTLGGIKVFGVDSSTTWTGMNAVANHLQPAIQLDSNYLGFISIPYAGTSQAGVIKTGYTTSGKNYKLQTDSNGNGYVNVPWTDNNTDTKNTAGSSNSTSKLYLVGATSQSSNGMTTYSNSNIYMTNGELTAKIISATSGMYSSMYNDAQNGDQYLSFNTDAQGSANGFMLCGEGNSTISVSGILNLNAQDYVKFDQTPYVNSNPIIRSDDTTAYKIKKLTQTQYNALSTKDASTIYLIVG